MIIPTGSLDIKLGLEYVYKVIIYKVINFLDNHVNKGNKQLFTLKLYAQFSRTCHKVYVIAVSGSPFQGDEGDEINSNDFLGINYHFYHLPEQPEKIKLIVIQPCMI